MYKRSFDDREQDDGWNKRRAVDNGEALRVPAGLDKPLGDGSVGPRRGRNFRGRGRFQGRNFRPMPQRSPREKEAGTIRGMRPESWLGLAEHIVHVFAELPERREMMASLFAEAVVALPQRRVYFAAVLAALRHAGFAEGRNISTFFLESVSSALNRDLSNSKWIPVRQGLVFLAHVTMLPHAAPGDESLQLLDTASFWDLLTRLATILENEEASGPLKNELALTLANVLLVLKAYEKVHELDLSGHVDALFEKISAFALNEKRSETISHYHAALSATSAPTAWYDYLDEAIKVLREPPADSFPGIDFVTRVPWPEDSVPETFPAVASLEQGSAVPVSVTSIALPTEMHPKLISEPQNALETCDPNGLSGSELVGVNPTLLRPSILPFALAPVSPGGILVRIIARDLLALYETNRRDAAQSLLDLPRWFAAHTETPLFDAAADEANLTQQILDDFLLDVVFSELFARPQPTYSPPFYFSLVTEICRITPASAGPALGRTIRASYKSLVVHQDSTEPADPTLSPLDIPRLLVFANWFSAHLSNFNFAWAWSDWAGPDDPRLPFSKHVVGLLVRLSYYDRIGAALPDNFAQTINFDAMQPQPTHFGSAFWNETPSAKPEAERLSTLLQSKAPADDLQGFLANIPEDMRVPVLTHAVLDVGRHSVSHLLNVIERYVDILQEVLPREPRTVLRELASFWQFNSQLHVIFISRFLRYRLVSSNDIAQWLFDTSESLDFNDLRYTEILLSTLTTLATRAGNDAAPRDVHVYIRTVIELISGVDHPLLPGIRDVFLEAAMPYLTEEHASLSPTAALLYSWRGD